MVDVLGIALAVLLGAGCEQVTGFDRRLNSLARPYRFSILRWELGNMLDRAKPLKDSGEFQARARDETEPVLEYFSLIDEIRALETEIDSAAAGKSHGYLAGQEQQLERLQQRKRALADTVELVLAGQIRETLNKQGLRNPADRYISLKIAFPPINLKLGQPPNLLVVSPRDRIESMRRIMLIQDIGLETIEDIEARVDALGVSALVVEWVASLAPILCLSPMMLRCGSRSKQRPRNGSTSIWPSLPSGSCICWT